ncbi:MAG: hypothetical protein IPH17_09545 [Bacteroidales bacterium]|nr:hypothetical protein [Bacteroidales bacterium]
MVYKMELQNYRFKDVADNLELPVYFCLQVAKEKMLDYIRCVVAGKSLRACAKEEGISLPTSLVGGLRYWQLYKVSKIISFFGVVETDELLMDYSEKGRIYKNAEEG